MQENIDLKDESQVPLRRVLGVFTAALLVAGNMIGTGVFKKIVPMAATGLGAHAILLAWIVAGLITILGAFTFAGLPQLTTAPGGSYEYVRICFEDLLAFLFGWAILAIVGSGSIAAVGFIFSQPVNSLIRLPEFFLQWQHVSIVNFIYPFSDAGIKLFAIAVILVLTWINYRGVRKGTILNNIITSSKILGIIFLILCGFVLKSPSIKSPSAISANFTGLPFVSVFFSAMLSAFWAYDGFNNVTAITGEIKNPKRNIPIAIISGVSIVMILYVLVNATFLHTFSLT